MNTEKSARAIRDQNRARVSSPTARTCGVKSAAPVAARQHALRGKEFVRRNFLMPRLLRDWLVLMNLLDGNDTAGAEVATVAAA